MDHTKDKLIAKFLIGNANEKEKNELDKWLHSDHLNQLEFDRAKKIWETSLALKKDKRSDVDLAWSQFKTLAETQTNRKVSTSRTTWMRIAAAVALFVVIGAISRIYFTENSNVTPALLSNISTVSQPESVAVITEVIEPDTFFVSNETASKKTVRKSMQREWKKNPGMITLITGDSAKAFLLPDHSVVLLNANSKLEYLANYSASNRRVSLLGEAFFEVKKDSGQFVVACENTVIRGKEASFNLKSFSTDKEVEVIVAAGEVEFSGIGKKEFKKLTLKAGQSGIYEKQKDTFVKKDSQRKNYKWWKKSLRASLKSFFDKLFGKNKKQNSNQLK